MGDPEGDDRHPVHVRADDLDLLIDDGGVLAIGGAAAVERLFESLDVPSSELAPTLVRPGLVQGLAAASLVKLHSSGDAQYFQFSPETLQRLREGRVTSAGGGFHHSGIQNAKGRFTGNVEWKQVQPQQLMSAQVVLAMAALELAIREVQAAVERVERKLDEVRRRIAAQQFGDVVGRHSYLQRQVELLDRTGRVTETDWMTIAALGPALSGDLVRLRAYVHQTVTDASSERGTDDRADAVRNLLDLEVDLDLLTVTEQSQFLFESLRLQHLRQNDPDALPAAVVEARRTLASQRDADRLLIEGLRTAGERLTRVRALEIHHVFSRRQLEAGVASLNELAARFAGSRSLEVSLIPAAEQPTAAEAFSEVRERAISVGAVGKRTVVETAALAKEKLQRGDREAIPSQIEAGTEAPALTDGRQETEEGGPSTEAGAVTEPEPEADPRSSPTVAQRLPRHGTDKPPRPPF